MSESKKARRNGMMAVMLGTALTAFAPSLASADEGAVRDLSRYCTACWRNARLPIDRWSDCTQEVFCRLLQRVPLEEWGAVLKGPEENKRRELFRVIDLVKKRVQREKKWSPLEPGAASDDSSQYEADLRETREQVQSAAASVLTPRQQLILRRSAEGCGVAEIASELKLPASRISDEKYKAIRRLQDYFS
jgi:RNA polymerase sigma factor (sigma-70 family)